jgi:hypothetical protein
VLLARNRLSNAFGYPPYVIVALARSAQIVMIGGSPIHSARIIPVELVLDSLGKPCSIPIGSSQRPGLPGELCTHWPAAAALERKDVQAIRWLAATALLDRLALAGNDPVGRPLLRTICQLVIGPDWQWYQAGCWCAYLLKDHPLLAPIDTTLPILAGGGGLAKFGELPASSIPRPLRLTSKSSRARNQKKS